MSQQDKQCAKCGACTAVCPVYRASGNEIYSARGKRHLAEVYDNQETTPVFEDIYSKCLLCGACSSVCPRKLDITEDVVHSRASFSALYGQHGYQKFLARKVLQRPELLGAARVLGRQAARILFDKLPIDSGLRLRLAMVQEPSVAFSSSSVQLPKQVMTAPEGTIDYFPGCATSYLYPEISRGVVELLASYGVQLHTPDGQACCGLAIMASGDLEGARRLAINNIQLFEQSDGPVLVSCGSCFAHLCSYEGLFDEADPYRTRARLVAERMVEVSQYVAYLQTSQMDRSSEADGEEVIRVFYHDPCHLRHDKSVTREPRELLAGLANVELVELPDGPQCCGQGGLFHVGAPELSAAIRTSLMDNIIVLQPDIITTSCSGCLMQLKSAVAAANLAIPVVHLARFLATQRSI